MTTAAVDKILPAGEFQYLATAAVFPSKTNPRKTFNPVFMKELTDSVSVKGVLTPILVRPVAKGHEIVFGEQRWRAAQAAGLHEIPARVKELDDVEVLEFQVIENLQRRDLHPLEEAAGYRALLKTPGYDVETIAAKVGRSVKYIYDRAKLLELTKEAQRLFREDRITAGHAILLARLSPDDQERAIEEWLFEDEQLVLTPEAEDDLGPTAGFKARSVRELAGSIDKHVRFEPEKVDQMVFPETAEVLATAATSTEKVVRLTHDVITPEDAKDGPKVVLGRSWKRADGKHGSKTCDHSVIGVIDIGPGRGEALRACVAKKSCAIHWPQEVKAAKKRETAAKTAVARGEDPAVARQREQKRQEEEREAEDVRWRKAEPAILAALVTALKKAPAGAGSDLGKIVLDSFKEGVYYVDAKAAKFLGPGKSAEDLVRHLGFLSIVADMANLSRNEWAKDVKPFGVDAKKILDEVAPLEKSKDKRPGPAKGKKASKAKRR